MNAERLDNISDWLSPIVVKEVRQMVRGRQFNYSFGLGLVAGLLVAFIGSADASNGNAAGAWIFASLIGCLIFIGMGIVPVGTFNALRNERSEQTLDLMTLTALSPRRIVIGKLLAQGVKLLTLFSALAPFIAMSFLLGGIDLVTILLALAALFIWSMWACAASLFMSSLSRSRAMSSLMLGVVALVFIILFGMGRSFYMFRYGFYGGPFGGPFGGYGTPGSDFWWMIGVTTAFCLITMVNLVLLAENRLSLPTEDRVTALRIGLFIQFLMLLASSIVYVLIRPAPPAGSFVPPGMSRSAAAASNAVAVLGVLGGLQLTIVATFTVTEDLILSRRVLLKDKMSKQWSWLMAMFRPGGGRGAAYVLAQMALFVIVGMMLTPDPQVLHWLVAICGYICFFTGVPTYVARRAGPGRFRAAQLRVLAFLVFPVVMLLPDILYYLATRSSFFASEYSLRHVLNPLRTLSNWYVVEQNQWYIPALLLGLVGFASYLALMKLGQRANAGADA